MNKLVIVIPGSSYVSVKYKWLQKLVLFFYKVTKISNPVYINYAKLFSHRLRRNNRRAIWLHWSRSINPYTRWVAVRKLFRLVKQYQGKHEIVLVGVSMGALIALNVAKRYPNLIIKKIILICSVIDNTSLYKDIKVPVINLYSPGDLFAKLSNKVLFPISGGVTLDEMNDVRNIEIPDFGHDDFCTDECVKCGEHQGKRISEIIDYYLEND